MSPKTWQVWVDTGGSFTDAVALDPHGGLHECKVLSSSALRARVAAVIAPERVRLETTWSIPDDFLRGFSLRDLGETWSETIDSSGASHRSHLEIQLRRRVPSACRPGTAVELRSFEEAPVLAARMITRTPSGEPLPPLAMRLATTRGTNALLQRRGARVAVALTEGFGDLLRIGTQRRPDLFALAIRKAPPLAETTLEVSERVGADGSVLRTLDVERAERDLRALRRRGFDVLAVALLNGYRNPEHEIRLARLARDLGFRHVSCSSQLSPSIELLPRAQTAEVDAYLAPVIQDYLRSVLRALRGEPPARRGPAKRTRAPLHVMTSAGGLVPAADFSSKDSLLSGPAGGVVGAAAAGRAAGFAHVISFDMGGTSTDVARVDEDYEYVFEHHVGDARLQAPALAIETVAAGGGSICRVRHGQLQVGPESSGAFPGPACYGAGGPLSLSDVNLLAGRLCAERFSIPLQIQSAERALHGVQADIATGGHLPLPREELLEGFLRIANERMAEAIRRVSLRRGYDPAEYALLAFGGAGGQHACAVAALLGMDHVIVPPRAGLLSATGLGSAVFERFAQRQILRPWTAAEPGLEGCLKEVAEEAVEAVAREGIPPSDIEVRRRILQLRYLGQDSTLDVDVETGVSPRDRFETLYEELFSHRPQRREIELVAVRVVASSGGDRSRTQTLEDEHAPARPAPAGGRARLLDGREWVDAETIDRRDLAPGGVIAGPALVVEEHSAVVVESGWTARVDPSRALVLAREAGRRPSGERARAGPIELELFSHRYESVAREMGELLRRTSVSTNVKERLDFSCAVLDAEGRLVVNAPHIPVHLGALGVCVRALREAVDLRPGDTVVTNHPRYGGSHLPDVTVVSPVHSRGGARLGYVASRAHHAELGGLTPGSLPAHATRLVEEGVVIPPLHLVRRSGESGWRDVEDVLTRSPYPTRALQDNLADLRAMVAANGRGVSALQELERRYGEATLDRTMRALRARAEAQLRTVLRARANGDHRTQEVLDDGSVLAVAVRIEGDEAWIDFTGTSPVHPGNLNATPAVVQSAIVYVMRLLVREDVPLNEGLLRPVHVSLPRSMLAPAFPDDPRQCPAIVGGNVETSQRLVNALLRALDLAACSQGTMNNLSFGTRRFGYYETLGGGSGAGPGFAGTSGVHTHMTNTRITDPEILEHRHPVRVRRFSLRPASGGAGAYRGGDGLVREIEFLEPMTVSLLSQHRREGPCGLHGGRPGLPGRQSLTGSSGTRRELRGTDQVEVEPGDRLRIETPGGGGYGEEGSGPA